MKSCKSSELLYNIYSSNVSFHYGPPPYSAECPQLQFDIHFILKSHKIDYNAAFNW